MDWQTLIIAALGTTNLGTIAGLWATRRSRNVEADSTQIDNAEKLVDLSGVVAEQHKAQSEILFARIEKLEEREEKRDKEVDELKAALSKESAERAELERLLDLESAKRKELEKFIDELREAQKKHIQRVADERDDWKKKYEGEHKRLEEVVNMCQRDKVLLDMYRERYERIEEDKE